MHEPVAGDERRGRKIILLISAAILVPQTLTVLAELLDGTPRAAAWAAIRLGLAVALSYLMWRGYSAARTYVGFTLFVGAALTVLGSLIQLFVTPLGLVGLIFGAGYAWAAWALWRSPHVEAYIDAREAARDPILSIRDGDGT